MGPQEGFPQPIIIVLRHPHLLPHDLRGGHGPPRPKRRHGVRHRDAGRTDGRGGRGGATSGGHSPGRTPLQHLQPQHLLHPAHRLRHHLVLLPPLATILVIGIKREGVVAPKAGRGPARREEYLVGCLPDMVGVEAVELPEGPRERSGVVEGALAVEVVVQPGGGGGGVGLAAGVMTHADGSGW